LFFHFIIRIIGRSQRHSFRSIMGFALIIAMIIAVSGVISGFSSQIFGITAKAGDSQSLFIAPSSPSDSLPTILPSMLNHTNVDVVLPLREETIELISVNSSFTVKIIGVNLSTLFDFYLRGELIGGSLPTTTNTTIECLMGKELQLLLPSLDIVVNHLSKNLSRALHVTGIVQNVKELQYTIILEMNDYLTVFNGTLDNSGYQLIKILLKNGAFTHDTISDLHSLLNDYYPNLIIKPEKQADVFTVSMFSDILEQLNLLFGVLFIIALIRIFHSISWFLSNYEREFLIMKACGLSSIQLFSLVGILAFVIGNAGLMIGLLLGLITPSIIFTTLTLFFYGSYIVPDFSISVVNTTIIYSNIIIFVAAAYPAVRLSLVKPHRLSIDTRGLDR
jgi:ABC-type lipoprotein release transport system permease subunit